MDLLLAIGNFSIGVFMLLIGFKYYDPFKGKNSEKMEKWYQRFGGFFKIGGIALIIIASLQFVTSL